MELPDQFKKKLDDHYPMQELVSSYVNEMGPWLERNRMKFFSEYTDHSLKHAEDVLKTSVKLIREECRSYITPQDAATLTLAALLHDCAMHLTKDGFLALINPETTLKIIPGFGDRPWSLLWEDFIAEAKRFSGRKLMSLFGDTAPIRTPPLDPNKMNDRDLLLIGEFLRRHHHRLAHEIALHGVPGSGEKRLQPHTREENSHIVDLAGLVARSHGLPMRACLEYLKEKYSSCKVQRGVHAVFLMALLRIADIQQIQAERAPAQVQKTETIRSPVSEGEWEMHQAIKDINTQEFPETILIHAEPPTVRSYLRIKRLLAQFQAELDETWTVIGETYAYDKEFQEFGLTIRRVRSNLDDEKAFSRKVDYIPRHAAFEVADTDLLKLLIGPLYGEDPAIGIRELMQNAIDAVRELDEYRKQHPQAVALTEQKGDVLVSLDEEIDGDWWGWVTVSDRGIGMSVDTVINYFLKAGASLRRSELWRETFEDEEGKSRVLRSGRFGVGILAAYLLGKEIQVSTRHVNASEGVEFSTPLDAEFIELKRLNRPVGTTIRVRISTRVKDELTDEKNFYNRLINKDKCNWDWYCLTFPKMVKKFRAEVLGQEYQLPPQGAKLPTSWYRIFHPDYEDIHWTLLKKAPQLTCNGIKISDFRSDTLFTTGQYSIRQPAVSVFDSNANFPLNLQRTDLTQSVYPFEKELLDAVIRDCLAYLIVNAPLHQSNWQWFTQKCFHAIDSSRQIPFDGQTFFLSPLFTVDRGFSFSYDSWLLNQLPNKNLLCLACYTETKTRQAGEATLIKGIANLSVPVYYLHFSQATAIEDIVQLTKFIYFLYNRHNQYQSKYSRYGDVNIHVLSNKITSEQRILINRDTLNQLYDLKKMPRELLSVKPLSKKFIEEISAKEEWSNKDWVLWQVGECPASHFDFKKFAEENPGPPADEWPGILVEWYLKEEQAEVELSPLARVWREVLGTPVIPFDLEERRRVLAKAYEELKPYIEAHEMSKQKFK